MIYIKSFTIYKIKSKWIKDLNVKIWNCEALQEKKKNRGNFKTVV
jgi:hypothetical protein